MDTCAKARIQQLVQNAGTVISNGEARRVTRTETCRPVFPIPSPKPLHSRYDVLSIYVKQRAEVSDAEVSDAEVQVFRC